MAFRGLEKHPEDQRFFSDDAELGADMKGAVYQAVIDIRDWLFAYSEARVKAAEEAAAANKRGH